MGNATIDDDKRTVPECQVTERNFCAETQFEGKDGTPSCDAGTPRALAVSTGVGGKIDVAVGGMDCVGGIPVVRISADVAGEEFNEVA